MVDIRKDSIGIQNDMIKAEINIENLFCKLKYISYTELRCEYDGFGILLKWGHLYKNKSLEWFFVNLPYYETVNNELQYTKDFYKFIDIIKELINRM